MSASIVEVVGVAYPVTWLPWAVLYFFLIGISAGAFALSVPGVVLRKPGWYGISRRALLAAVLCAVTAPLALVSDLHQPGRFLNFYLHSNFSSWMAWGAYFIPFYLLALLAYAWLAMCPTLGVLAAAGGAGARWYRRLSLSGKDRRGAVIAAAFLAGVGAALLLLYSGMEVMVVSARPLWRTPLLPLLFAVSGLSAAVGIVHLLDRILHMVDPDATRLLNRVLAATQLAVLAIFALWLALALSGVSSTHAQAWQQVAPVREWRLMGAWLVVAAIVTLGLATRRPQYGVLAGLFALLSAWSIRWALLIDGQALSKIGPRYDPYHMPLGSDGWLGMLGISGLWVALFVVLISLLPWGNGASSRQGA